MPTAPATTLPPAAYCDHCDRASEDLDDRGLCPVCQDLYCDEAADELEQLTDRYWRAP
jgi:Zn finger protein HypA/HybF involved in hydrogenase expression